MSEVIDGCAQPYNNLDVGKAGDVFYVGWVDPDEWIEWRDVYLKQGRYEITARYVTPNENAQLCVRANSGAEHCTTPASTGGFDNWATFVLPRFDLETGLANLRFTFKGGQMNVDRLSIDKVVP